ncbi:NnrS family protein [Parahaliea sp. F7430]|uniref:NnrS family protein n=1 Tax=Sediminihaliea albiluteola TaxID=2758564 RepID=A0A7W2TWT4_9GAMM|nr:NnrS family protein [Sediminihaliea albiluteola]MBA6413416.1 NnrS family protein [Sediminihaliea albiluteola]
MPNNQPPILLAYAFRPFFLLSAFYAAAAMAVWISAILGGPVLLPATLTPDWHAHELVYGFVGAAIAGFLLTAITNWTGSAPLAGTKLALLLLLWFAGRIAMAFNATLAPAVVALLDLSFLLALALYVALILWRTKNRRNAPLVLVLLTLVAGNALMHAGWIQRSAELILLGRNLALDLITVLMTIVAGRITPAFSANWLRARGETINTVATPRLDQAAIGSVALMALCSLAGAAALVTGLIAITAGLLNALRLYRWAGWRIRREPLLWILHLAYGFIVAALLARGLVLLDILQAPSLWQHLIGAGAMGILVLGVMTRVSMGHTGRPLALRPGGLVIYIAIIVAALLRVLVALNTIDYQSGLLLSAGAWIVAFALFCIAYAPVLWSPRADGRPG